MGVGSFAEVDRQRGVDPLILVALENHRGLQTAFCHLPSGKVIQCYGRVGKGVNL